MRRISIIVIFLVAAVYIANVRLHAKSLKSDFDTSSSFEDAYLSLIAEAGGSILDIDPNDRRSGDRSVRFKVMECPYPYEIFEQRIVLSLPHHVNMPPLSDMLMRVIYYDEVWGEWNRAQNTLKTITVSIASVFNRTAFHDNMEALLLFIPDGCDDLAGVDWAQAWTYR